MKKKTQQMQDRLAPFPDGKEAEPHYTDTIDPELIKPTPKPTPPNAEPSAPGSMKMPENTSEKIKDLDTMRDNGMGKPLTTNLGVKIADDQNTLKAGSRGPSLLEDFHFLEKMAHFDQERIPERVVHARGSGAHGYFQVYKSLSKYTKAAFLQDPSEKTPVFVRFSNVQGFRGSPDTVRDIRGFATKFYTREGNYDLVGNDTPVFFIQDSIKFPDFIHAVKPEPHNEMPQGQTAHDSFWDYVSLQPETLHNVMWLMSDRGIPRSYRTIEGFGIHTYKLVNEDGKSTFVRFHWKPVYGKKSLIWDEAQDLTGRDPDFHRKDLWQSIEGGDYPEFELGLQIIPEEDLDKFDFDILDATKLIPEALVPVEIVGKMVLNRNPDNFFAETEQVAFCPANIVPGIDFSDDPLLQGRIFSYSDTQRHRLGGANFTEIPINRPVCPFHNNQRDGFHRMQIDTAPANYNPNSIGDNWPRETPEAAEDGGFTTTPERVEGIKERLRSPSFAEYYSHPRLFWMSQTPVEQEHIIKEAEDGARLLKWFADYCGMQPETWMSYWNLEIKTAMYRALFRSKSRYSAILWPALFDINKRLNIPGTTGGTNWRERMPFKAVEACSMPQTAWLRSIIDDSDRTPLQGEDAINALKASSKRIFPKVTVNNERFLKRMLMWPNGKSL